MKLAAIALLVSSLAYADTAKVAVSAGGKCSVALPIDWSATGAVAQSKDKKVSVAVSQPKAAASFGDLKATLKKSVKDAKVVKDSDQELELEGKAVDGKPNVYRVVAASGVFCAAEARYDGAGVDVARSIVHSLAAAK